MTNEDSETQILRDLFESTLDSILGDRKAELGLSDDQIDSFKKAYSYLFALAYGNKWTNDLDELVQRVDDLISESIGGD